MNEHKRHWPSYVLTLITKPLLRFVVKGSLRSRVILRSGDEILLVRGRLGSQRWSLPGGGVRKGEDPLLAAQREVFEEVRITLQPEQLKLITEGRHQRTPRLHFFYRGYEAPVVKQAINFDKREILAAEWFDIHKLPDDMSELSGKIIRAYLAGQPVSL